MNFLIIIGAPKAGTSTLATQLARHPRMRLCARKEPCFFTDFADIGWRGPGADRFVADMITDEAAYLAGFGDAGPQDWCIDASTDYLSCPVSAGPNPAWARGYRLRLVCVLRDPVQRAVSQYQHTVRDRLERGSLARALDLEPRRAADHWQPLFGHLRRSRYHADLRRYRELFGDALLLLDAAELRDRAATQRRIEVFLGLDPAPVAATPDMNVSHVPRSLLLGDLLHHARRRGLTRWPGPARLLAALERANRTRYVPRRHDLARLHAALAEEYALCLPDPEIPTASWVDWPARLAAG